MVVPTLIPLPPSPLNMEKGNVPSPYSRERVCEARVRVNKRGQTITEFLVMLGLLTLVGALLAKTLMGPKHTAGAIGTMQDKTIKAIANDTD
jgi:hypothetical protein